LGPTVKAVLDGNVQGVVVQAKKSTGKCANAAAFSGTRMLQNPCQHNPISALKLRDDRRVLHITVGPGLIQLM